MSSGDAVEALLDAVKRGEGLQKINVKLFLEAPSGADYDFLLPIFGRWRLEEGEEIIDLADYLHVPDGPGCLLVSHRWHFGIDFTGGRPGIFLSTRKGLEGDAESRFAHALRACAEKGQRLLAEEEVPPGVRLRPGELEVVVNDRVLFPNCDESEETLRPGLVAALDGTYGKGACTLERERDPRRRLGWLISPV